MMLLYDALLLLVFPLLRFAAVFHKRLAENFHLRRRLPDFSVAAGKTHIWFHASSAGEFEQVRAIGIEMKRAYKNLFLSFSYFSDSAHKAKKTDSVPDLFFALPYDFPWAMRRLVRLMKPAALVVGKYDAWPNQVMAATKAGIPVYLASATLPEKSVRHKFPLKFFLRQIYAPMRRIFAISQEHADRLRKISPHNVIALGDTRFDAICERLKEATGKREELRKLKQLSKGKTVIVCGSTYETSESMILEYLAGRPEVRGRPVAAILAPHHIRDERILSIEARCRAHGLTVSRWSRRPGKPVDVIIVDGLGLLPFLYRYAHVAYIGGGFEGSVHSVIEAAVGGVPMITGPAISNSEEALRLQALGLLTLLIRPEALEFAKHVENLCKTRTMQSKKIRGFFRQRVGVARKIMHTVMDELNRK